MKFSIPLGGGTLEFEGDTLQEIIEQASAFMGLPTHCPVDNMPAVFRYNQAGSYKYYSLVSTGGIEYEYKLGTRTDDRKMYPKYYPHEAWVIYDPDRNANVCVWLDGKDQQQPYPTIEKPKGKPVRINGKEIPTPARTFSINSEEDDDDSLIPPPQTQKTVVATSQPAPAGNGTKPAPNGVVQPGKTTTQPAGNGSNHDTATSGKVDPVVAKKKAMLVPISAVAKSIYGDGPAAGQVMLRIGRKIAQREINGLLELTGEQISQVDRFVQLDMVGVNTYGNVLEWQDALKVLLTEFKKESVYDLTPHQLARLKQMITDAPVGGEDNPFN